MYYAVLCYKPRYHGKRLTKYIGYMEWWSTQLLFIFIPIFLFIYSSIIHPSPAILTPPPSLQCLHTAILYSQPVLWASVGRTELVVDGTYSWSILPIQTNNCQHQHLEALRSLYTLHGDLMLMATLETAGGPLVQWMAGGLLWRFPPQSRPCKENQVCNTQLCRMVQAWGEVC